MGSTPLCCSLDPLDNRCGWPVKTLYATLLKRKGFFLVQNLRQLRVALNGWYLKGVPESVAKVGLCSNQRPSH